MSFDKKYPGTVFIGPHFPSGTAKLLEEQPNESASGFDSLAQDWLIHDQTKQWPREVDYLPRGTRIGSLNMWVTSRAVSQLGAGVFMARITSQGLLSPRGARVSYSSAASSQTGENVVANGVLRRRVVTQENVPTISIEEIVVESLTAGITGGVAEDPPAFAKPPDPTSVWSFLTDPTYHWPNQWVKMEVGKEGLPGVTGIAMRTTRYQWIHALAP